MIQDHEEIVPECKGCIKVMYCILTKKYICGRHPFPRTQWWFEGIPCDDASHHHHKPYEDPIKEP